MTRRRTFYTRYGKRAFDIAAVTVGGLFTLPVQAAVAIAVRRKLGSPVVFKQQRPGLHGKPFEIRKFRTMTQEVGTDGRLLPDDQRLTRFGGLLRSTSLDELPELHNVLMGDMSLVGPRPLLTSYLDRYTPAQARRHEVRPGITGWAQVNGRNAVSWEEKFEQDVWYVDNVSFFLDLRILWKTLTAVLLRDGISSEGHVTAPEFTGTEQGLAR